MKPFSQAIFQCHISSCLIHEVQACIIYHHQVELPGSPDHWAVALGRRMLQRNIRQSKTRRGFCCISIFNQPKRSSWMLYAGILSMHARLLVFRYVHAHKSSAYTHTIYIQSLFDTPVIIERFSHACHRCDSWFSFVKSTASCQDWRRASWRSCLKPGVYTFILHSFFQVSLGTCVFVEVCGVFQN